MRAGYRVRGRVQGVGFRAWTRSQALRLGITGTVRNCADGTVEIQAQGTHDSIERFRELLRHGPPAAVVESVQQIPTGAASERNFRIVG